MKYRKIISSVLFVALTSCSQTTQTKIEYEVDRAGNPDYKKSEYQYILGSDSKGNDVEIKHGLTKEFYQSGQLKAEVNFDNGKVNGQLKVYFESGKVAEISNWKNDSLNGLAKYYYDNGVLYQEANYKAGRLNGEQNTFYENGNLKTSLLYKDGLLWQATINHDSIGNKLDEMTMTNGTGVLNIYYPSGVIKSVTEFKDGKPNGKSVWYFESGKAQAVFYLVAGKKDGKLITFHENGKPAKESFYKDGFIIGTEKAFNVNGVLISEVNYKEELTQEDIKKLTGGILGVVSEAIDPFKFGRGIMDGTYKTYYANGRIESEQYYFNGLQDSLFKEYFDNGIIKTDIFFDDNYTSNKRYERRFDKTGKLITSLTFPPDGQLTNEEKKLKETLERKPKD